MSDKILPTHRERAAYVYVRQSTLQQVRHHHEGRQRQYALCDRAHALGFSKVVVVDDDLGVSGSGKQERRGFGRLLAAVCEGEVGAVFALEASRLARNNRDWHHLIDLCAMTETLLIDDDGEYDPRLVNDRLLLGLKGTMSEFELSLFRQRAREAFEQKVRRGHVMWELPVGFVRTADHRIEKSPDRQVQQAIEMVFRKFRELGSARQTMLYFRDEQLPLPDAVRGTAGEEIVWRVPGQSRVLQILRNPCYAGAIVYGKSAAAPVARGDRAAAGRRRKKPIEQWRFLLRDSHSGYITWDDYLSNQRLLEANLSRRQTARTGAALRGSALLSRLLRCGRCGRTLFVAYTGRRGTVARYVCRGGRVERGSAPCQSLGSFKLDRTITELFLQAIQPVGIEAALRAAEHATLEDAEKRRAVEMALEKARYEATRAQRRFEAVDAENRLVAAELEARWERALHHVHELESRAAGLRDETPELSEAHRARLRDLATDTTMVWNHPAAPIELKKRILRTVIEEIVCRPDDDHEGHSLAVHWKGGVHSKLRLKKNGAGHHHRVADDKAVELIVELSKVHDDKTIATVLNRLGLKTGQGNAWHQHHVQCLRYTRGLAKYRRNGDWLTLEGAARELGLSTTAVKHMIQGGVLPASQVIACAPWIIEREDLRLPAVQRYAKTACRGRRRSLRHPSQCEIPLK